MVDRFTETLVLEIAGVQERFPFEICRKSTRFDDLEISQHWIDHAAVYGQRNQVTHRSIIEFFWAVCRQNGAATDCNAQQKYILARLFPETRINGARRVVADGVLVRPSSTRITSGELIHELQADLAASATSRMNSIQFRDETANLLGPERFDDEARGRYLEFIDELLGDNPTPAFDSHRMDMITEKWRRWMNGTARHRGNQLKKQIIDIVSYEARTALHCAYSVVWCYLVPQLFQRYDFNDEWFRFHSFWHRDHCCESNVQHDLFHLFHGHIFALHPAMGTFLRTRTGAQQVASWLRNPESEEDYQRLLHGLFVAVGQYSRQHELIATLRNSGGDARYARRIDEIFQAERRRHRS